MFITLNGLGKEINEFNLHMQSKTDVLICCQNKIKMFIMLLVGMLWDNSTLCLTESFPLSHKSLLLFLSLSLSLFLCYIISLCLSYNLSLFLLYRAHTPILDIKFSLSLFLPR